MSKNVKSVIVLVVLVAMLVAIYLVLRKPSTEDEPNFGKTNGMLVVPTMLDKIAADSSWCGTFQLIWNDMKNEVVKRDIVFTPQEEMADNLNKEEFKESMISDDYYFKKYGLKTLDLKEEIEKGIKEKFNQTSDILSDFDWSEEELNSTNNLDEDRYFFYVMLYRKFEFLKEFDKLDKGKFGDNYNDIEYFGISDSTDDTVRDQIKVLYYNSKDDFAIIINTKTNDEVIFCKNPNGTTFKEIYDNMNTKTESYEGSISFQDNDTFKAPNLTFNEKREYLELQEKEFMAEVGPAEIVKAIQTIKFSLNEKGGEIKSESGIDLKLESAAMPEEPRQFYIDDTFAIFLRESGQELPYFAGRVDNITKFQ
jgi:Serpin (serine protease inhibitor).